MTTYTRAVKYDVDVLDMLIYKANALGLDRKSERQLRSTLECLIKYKRGNGKYNEVYMNSAGSGGFGRYYPKGAGMAYLHRPARGSLVRDFYYDLDMVNSLPAITIQFARRFYKRDLVVLRKYVEDRDTIHNMLIDEYKFVERTKNDIVETPRDQAKTLVNAVFNGKSLKDTPHPWLKSLRTEMYAFASLLEKDAQFADLLAETKANNKSPASFMSKIVQREEAKVLVCMDKALTALGRVPASWIYDGLFVEKVAGETELPATIVEQVIAMVDVETGYKIGLKVKGFEPYPWLDEELALWKAKPSSERTMASILMSNVPTSITTLNMNHAYVEDCLNDPSVLEAIASKGLRTDNGGAGCNTLVLKSHLGTGKTTEAVKMIMKYKRVLIVSGRKTFTRFIMGDLEREGLGFVAYDDQKLDKKLSQYDRIVCQAESLWKLEEDAKDYEFVIIDESETILNQFYSMATHKDRIRTNHIMFERFCRNAYHALFADAFVGQRTLTAVEHLRDPVRAVYINNTFCPYKRTATRLYATAKTSDSEVCAIDTFCQRIMADLEAKKRVVVVWTSLKKAESFIETYIKESTYNYRLYSSKSSAKESKELADVETNWAGLDLLLYTTSITVGLNYNPDDEAKRFDRIYLYGCAKSALPRDIAQALLRCRKITSNELIYTIDPLVTDHPAYQIDEIRKNFHERRSALRTANPVINWVDSPKWVEDNFVLNERENALKSVCYGETLKDYLLESGYTITSEACGKQGKLTEADKMESDTIRLIDYVEADEIRTAIIRGEASEMDRQMLKRFNFHKQLDILSTFEPSETRNYEQEHEEYEEIDDQLWDVYYEDKDDTQKHYWNLVNEKHNTTEEYVMRETKGKYTEMVHSRTDQRIVLDKVLPLLGMKNTAEGKSNIVVDDAMIKAFEPLEADIYKAFGKKGKVTRTKALSGSHIADMVKMIWADWNGIEPTAESKEKRIGGGKKIRVFTVEIPAETTWYKYISARMESPEDGLQIIDEE